MPNTASLERSSPALRADSILTAVAGVLAGIGFVALALSELAHVTSGDAVGATIVASTE